MVDDDAAAVEELTAEEFVAVPAPRDGDVEAASVAGVAGVAGVASAPDAAPDVAAGAGVSTILPLPPGFLPTGGGGLGGGGYWPLASVITNLVVYQMLAAPVPVNLMK